MKKQTRKSVIIDTIPTSLILSVGKGAYKGYKKGGVRGAIAGGVSALILDIVGKCWPIGAV